MSIKKLITLFITLLAWIVPAFAGEVPINFDTSLSEPSFNTSMTFYNPYELKKGEIVFNEASIKINAVNPTAYSNKSGSYFPGARGANQLVIYTGGYGVRTGTKQL